jgi:hypothetical protein
MSAQPYDPRDLRGRTVYSADGEKLGKVEDVHEDDRGVAQYVEIKTGWIRGAVHAVPAHELSSDGDDLRAPYTRDHLEAAPTFEPGDDLDYERERTLGGHYGHPVREWDETRDWWLSGEDLSRGPTPETRHPDGLVDDVADTTQGPTPTTRRTMRATATDRAAAGEPDADPATRADIGGNQDVVGDRRVRLRRWQEDRAATRR